MAEVGERLAVVEEQIDRLERDVNNINETLQEVRDIMLQAQGGWKAALLIAGAGGVVGGAIATIAPIFWGH